MQALLKDAGQGLRFEHMEAETARPCSAIPVGSGSKGSCRKKLTAPTSPAAAARVSRSRTRATSAEDDGGPTDFLKAVWREACAAPTSGSPRQSCRLRHSSLPGTATFKSAR